DYRRPGIKIAAGQRHRAGAHDHAQSERPAGANHDRQSAGIPPSRANGLSTNGKRRDWVTRGLDPRVHLLHSLVANRITTDRIWSTGGCAWRTNSRSK